MVLVTHQFFRKIDFFAFLSDNFSKIFKIFEKFLKIFLKKKIFFEKKFFCKNFLKNIFFVKKFFGNKILENFRKNRMFSSQILIFSMKK